VGTQILLGLKAAHWGDGVRGQGTENWARHRQKAICVLGTLLIMAAIGTLGAAAQTSTAEDDPLAMFTEMMPVWSSPRCVNCHGGTIPDVKPEGLNHEGGLIDVVRDDKGDPKFDGSGTCQGCHDAAPPSWRLAPARMSLVDKDALTLCRQMRKVNSLSVAANRAAFDHHLHNDPLIDLAFVGNRGMEHPDPAAAAPPSMGKEAFFSAAQRWLEDGLASCSNKWTGTITETTTASESVTFAPAAGGRQVSTESHLTINVDENEATATLQWEMKDFTDVPTRECQAYSHQTFFATATLLPVSFTIAMNPTIPTGPLTMPELPPGFTLPPGFSLPPGATQPPGLPPGMTLPPGFEMPSMTPGGAFFQYAPTDKSEVTGTHRSETQSLPGCKREAKDERHAYNITGAHVDSPVDPNDPNHLVGEKTIEAKNGKTVIKWDLRRANSRDD
jgi:hypothetical protein